VGSSDARRERDLLAAVADTAEVENVTARTRRERALQRSEQLFRDLTARTSDIGARCSAASSCSAT